MSQGADTNICLPRSHVSELLKLQPIFFLLATTVGISQWQPLAIGLAPISSITHTHFQSKMTHTSVWHTYCTHATLKLEFTWAPGENGGLKKYPFLVAQSLGTNCLTTPEFLRNFLESDTSPSDHFVNIVKPCIIIIHYQVRFKGTLSPV